VRRENSDLVRDFVQTNDLDFARQMLNAGLQDKENAGAPIPPPSEMRRTAMFDYDQGLGLGKWLWWFMAAMVVYGVLTLFPENAWAAKIGALAAIAGIAIARHQIVKSRREK
jgi:hypothetical protein